MRDVAYEGLPFRRRQHAARAGRPSRSRREHRPRVAVRAAVAALLPRRAATTRRGTTPCSPASGRRAKYANGEAIDFFERAVEAARTRRRGPPPSWPRVLEPLGDVRFLVGLPQRGRRMPTARPARHVRGDPVAAREIMRARRPGSTSGCGGSRSRATAHPRAARARTASPTREPRVARSLLARRYAFGRFSQGRVDEALRWATLAAAARPRTSVDKDALAQAYDDAARSSTSASGRPEDAALRPAGAAGLRASSATCRAGALPQQPRASRPSTRAAGTRRWRLFERAGRHLPPHRRRGQRGQRRLQPGRAAGPAGPRRRGRAAAGRGAADRPRRRRRRAGGPGAARAGPAWPRSRSASTRRCRLLAEARRRFERARRAATRLVDDRRSRCAEVPARGGRAGRGGGRRCCGRLAERPPRSRPLLPHGRRLAASPWRGRRLDEARQPSSSTGWRWPRRGRRPATSSGLAAARRLAEVPGRRPSPRSARPRPRPLGERAVLERAWASRRLPASAAPARAVLGEQQVQEQCRRRCRACSARSRRRHGRRSAPIATPFAAQAGTSCRQRRCRERVVEAAG